METYIQLKVIVLKVRCKYPLDSNKYGNHSCYKLEYGTEKVKQYCQKLNDTHRDMEYKVEIEDGEVSKNLFHKYRIKLKDSIGLMELIDN